MNPHTNTSEPSQSAFSGRFLRIAVALGAAAALFALGAGHALAAGSATTDPATKVHHTSSVLNGRLDPEADSVTDCWFDWGTSTSYGSTVDCAEGDSFASAAEVSALINNLTPATTYHFRLHIDTASSGELTGADQTLTPPQFVNGRPVLTEFGPDGPGACPGFVDATGTGDFIVATGTGDSSLLASGRGDLTAGSTTVTNLTTTTGAFSVGESISSFSIPGGTTITGVGSGTLTLSNAAVSTSTGASLASGSKNLTNVTTDSGAYHVGDAIWVHDGVTVDNTTITGVGSGTLTLSNGVTKAVTGSDITAGLITNVSTACGSFAVGQTISLNGFPRQIIAIGGGTLTTSRPPTVPGTGVALSASLNFPNAPNQLAFDPASGRLHALVRGGSGSAWDRPASIYGFDAALTPLAGFSPLATGIAPGPTPSLAADPATGRILFSSEKACNQSTCGTDKLYAYDSAGSPLAGNFPLDPSVSPGGIANLDLCGATFDSAGHIWLGTGLGSYLLEYDATGAFIRSIYVKPPNGARSPCRLAFDSNDDLWFSSGNLGDLYKHFAPAYDPAAALDPGGRGKFGIDVNTVTDHLFALSNIDVTMVDTEAYAKVVDERDADGAVIRQIGSNLLPAPGYAGVAADPTTDNLYAADAARDRIRLFGPPGPVPYPTPTTRSARVLSPTTARLNARVDPEGVAVSECSFQWGFTSSYGNTAPCDPDPATIGGGSGDVAVFADISGLIPDATYHFRIRAGNQNGYQTGADDTFTATPGPQVGVPSVSGLSYDSANLDVEINPSGTETSYHAQYVPRGAYDLEHRNEAQLLSIDATGGTFALSFAGAATGATGAGTTDASSKTITGLTTTTGKFVVGEALSGTNIPADAVVSAVNTGAGTLTFAAASNATASGPVSDLAADLPWNAGAGSVAAALNALPTIGGLPSPGSVSVVGGPGGSAPYTITFGGSLSYSGVPELVPDSSALNGATATATVTTDTEGDDGFATALTAPIPDGTIPVGDDPTPITIHLSGLDPNTTYYYRLFASNADGTAIPPADAAFTTLGKPHTVETVGSPIRTTTTARLDGRLDPSGIETGYHFEWGVDDSYGNSTPEASAGSGELIRLVSAELSGLSPNTTYHYRLVADNAAPGSPVAGGDRTLTTRASDAPLGHGDYPGPPGSDRAWEQVNQPDTGGNPVNEVAGLSSDGERAIYRVYGGTPGSVNGTLFDFAFARRPAGQHPGSGWQTEPIWPSRAEAPYGSWRPPTGDDDLTTLLGLNLEFQEGTPAAAWRVPTDGSASTKLYDVAPGVYADGGYIFSDDGSRALLVLTGSFDLAHPTPPNDAELYDVSDGSPKLVNLLPGELVSGCAYGTAEANGDIFHSPGTLVDHDVHFVSPDGSRAYFNGCGSQPNLFLRDLEAGATTQIDASPISGPDCGAALVRSTDAAVYFWSQSRLDPDDTAPASCSGGTNPSAVDGDVYRYDLGGGGLSCVSCAAAGIDADVIAEGSFGAGASASIAVSGDGSRVYFQTKARLLPGANPAGQIGAYRVDAQRHLAYVAPLGDGTALGDAALGDAPTAGTAPTADGSALLFRAADSGLDALTASDNGGTSQYYLYRDTDRSLACVSCPADGSEPRGAAYDSVAATATRPGPNLSPIADDGTVAFATPTALVAADQNTAPSGENATKGQDVYEFRDGLALLVSDGETSWEGKGPWVGSISHSGRDLFFFASAQYTEDALDGFERLYDARIGGGIDFPPAELPPCDLSSGGCEGPASAAPEPSGAGSAVFAGPGNPPIKWARKHKKRCPKGKRKVRRKGKVRCVKRHHKRKHHKRKAKKHHNRRAQR